MRSHQRAELEDFLRREYGVREFRAENGSKHLKLIWVHQGKEFSRFVSYGPHGGEYRTLANMRAEIRRMMGGRPQKEATKTMEEQMKAVRERAIEEIAAIPDESRMPQPEPDNYPEPEPEPAPQPAQTWAVKAAAYNLPEGRPAVHFEFPAVIRQTVPTFRLEQVDAEHWRIRRHGPRRWSNSSRSGSGACTSMASDCEPFRSVTVEAVEVDGEVLVFVPMSARQPPLLRTRQRTMRAVETPRPEPQPSEPHLSVTLEDGMRAVLRYAREIEALSPYRLIRAGDGLSWRAPTIE